MPCLYAVFLQWLELFMKTFDRILPPLIVGTPYFCYLIIFMYHREAVRIYLKTCKSAYQRRQAGKDSEAARLARHKQRKYNLMHCTAKPAFICRKLMVSKEH